MNEWIIIIANLPSVTTTRKRKISEEN